MLNTPIFLKDNIKKENELIYKKIIKNQDQYFKSELIIKILKNIKKYVENILIKGY